MTLLCQYKSVGFKTSLDSINFHYMVQKKTKEFVFRIFILLRVISNQRQTAEEQVEKFKQSTVAAKGEKAVGKPWLIHDSPSMNNKCRNTKFNISMVKYIKTSHKNIVINHCTMPGKQFAFLFLAANPSEFYLDRESPD